MSEPLVIVVVAMHDEAEPFLRRATSVGEPVVVGAAEQRVIVVDGYEILLVVSGIGLVNAAGATTSAILRASASGGAVDAVVSAGTAGGLGPDIRVGDVVVGSSYVNLDADARVFGYELGQVPGMPARYAGTAALVDAALAFDVPETDSWTVHAGLIASSYAFTSAERAAVVHASFEGVAAADMESIAIAQICHSHEVAFVSVRGISDLGDDDAPDEHLTNVTPTSRRSSDVVVHIVSTLVGARAA